MASCFHTIQSSKRHQDRPLAQGKGHRPHLFAGLTGPQEFRQIGGEDRPEPAPEAA